MMVKPEPTGGTTCVRATYFDYVFLFRTCITLSTYKNNGVQWGTVDLYIVLCVIFKKMCFVLNEPPYWPPLPICKEAAVPEYPLIGPKKSHFHLFTKGFYNCLDVL